MGTRALEFSNAHPDADEGYALAAARLEQLVARAGRLAAAQREGLIHVHAASTRKVELRRAMLEVPIAHLAVVGQTAAREEHQLGSTFRFKPSASTFLAFRTAAGSMAEGARAYRELLVRHGLAASVLEEFGRMLEQFDAAVALGNEGRTAHIGATRELEAVASEIVRTVRVMDGRNRQRFQEDGQLLGAWLSARTVLGTPRGGPGGAGTAAGPEGGRPAEVRPAA